MWHLRVVEFLCKQDGVDPAVMDNHPYKMAVLLKRVEVAAYLNTNPESWHKDEKAKVLVDISVDDKPSSLSGTQFRSRKKLKVVDASHVRLNLIPCNPA